MKEINVTEDSIINIIANSMIEDEIDPGMMSGKVFDPRLELEKKLNKLISYIDTLQDIIDCKDLSKEEYEILRDRIIELKLEYYTIQS